MVRTVEQRDKHEIAHPGRPEGTIPPSKQTTKANSIMRAAAKQILGKNKGSPTQKCEHTHKLLLITMPREIYKIRIQQTVHSTYKGNKNPSPVLPKLPYLNFIFLK